VVVEGGGLLCGCSLGTFQAALAIERGKVAWPSEAPLLGPADPHGDRVLGCHARSFVGGALTAEPTGVVSWPAFRTSVVDCQRARPHGQAPSCPPGSGGRPRAGLRHPTPSPDQRGALRQRAAVSWFVLEKAPATAIIASTPRRPAQGVLDLGDVAG